MHTPTGFTPLAVAPPSLSDRTLAFAFAGTKLLIGGSAEAPVVPTLTELERAGITGVRHYLGRVFATAASVILKARVYDTQCGAKLFRATPAVSAALAEPFLSRWAFDVEFLGRLLIGTPAVGPLPLNAIVEVPLAVWHDVKGSKLGIGGMAKTVSDLALVANDLAARRRAIR